MEPCCEICTDPIDRDHVTDSPMWIVWTTKDGVRKVAHTSCVMEAVITRVMLDGSERKS